MGYAGTAIHTARIAAGMSLRELARRSSTNAGYLSQVERGDREPTERWLRDVEAALAEAIAEMSKDGS